MADLFYDIFSLSLNHAGEELCGDQVRTLRTPARSIIVLSDGLGSGVKANILARLTSSIIVTMLREEASLQAVIETVVGTLPTCKVRQIAYATFVIVEIEHATGCFKVINFDSPDIFFLRAGRLVPLTQRTETVLGKQLRFCEGQLADGDFLAAISDGVMYAGIGTVMNLGWGWKQIGEYLEKIPARRAGSAEMLVRKVLKKAADLYGGEPGDDATFVGILARQPKRVLVFTGPPIDRTQDAALVTRLNQFDGRKVVCGGTTANIVAEHLGEVIETDPGTRREDVPPIGWITGIDLVTEGILTLAKTLQLLKACGGDPHRLPGDRNGAVLLTRELLRADTIHFLAGEQVNPYYQNPLLPRNISIRHNLVDQVATMLQGYHRTVTVEWV